MRREKEIRSEIDRVKEELEKAVEDKKEANVVSGKAARLWTLKWVLEEE